MDEKNKRSEPQIPIRKEYIGAGRSDSISNGQPNDKRTRRRPDEYMDPGMPIQNKEPEKSSAEEIIFEENNSRRAPSKTPNLSRAEADKKRPQAPKSTELDGATRISAITTKAQPNAPKRPEKKQKKGYSESSNSVMSIVKCIAYITGVFAAAVILSVIIILSANDIFAFSKPDNAVEIEIPEGAGIKEVSEVLRENDVIKYKFLFKTYAQMKKKDEGFKPGKYTVSPSMNYDTLLGEFKEKPQTGIQWVTIPEGYTVDETINLLVEKGIGTKERYIEIINEFDFDYWFIDEIDDDWASTGRIYRLEGYLFPDSYQFYNASSEEAVVDKMLTRFNQVFTENYRARAAEMGYTVDEILTLASIIEKEAGNLAEFNTVSSVFHNRINSPNFQNLESDATVMYAIQHDTGIRPDLTAKDMEYDTPYNTYANPGFPPGPIASPSSSAIIAALNPSATDFYYFVSYAGNTRFARTLDEHNANKRAIAEEKEKAAAENTGN